jgi:peptidoglycan hydrolase FlgJ
MKIQNPAMRSQLAQKQIEAMDPTERKELDGKMKQLSELSEDFESIFVNIMLKTMRESVQKSELTTGGPGEDVFSSMLDQEYARVISSDRNSGIADSIEKDMQKLVLADFGIRAEGVEAYRKMANQKRGKL